MNCKLGDLAIVTGSVTGQNGKIVRCLEYAGLVSWHNQGVSLGTLPTWKTDTDFKCNQFHPAPNAAYWIPDGALRPIRDTDGTDETLEWAGVPAPVVILPAVRVTVNSEREAEDYVLRNPRAVATVMKDGVAQTTFFGDRA